jgi:hypothetical protein
VSAVNVGMLVQSPPSTGGGLAFEERLRRTFAYGEGEPYLPSASMRPIIDTDVQGGERSARGVRA